MDKKKRKQNRTSFATASYGAAPSAGAQQKKLQRFCRSLENGLARRQPGTADASSGAAVALCPVRH